MDQRGCSEKKKSLVLMLARPADPVRKNFGNRSVFHLTNAGRFRGKLTLGPPHIRSAKQQVGGQADRKLRAAVPEWGPWQIVLLAGHRESGQGEHRGDE